MEKEINLKINKRLISLFSWIIFIFLILVLIFYINKNFSLLENYVLVYTNDGNIYLGKISYFPRLKLTNVFILNTTNQNQRVFVPLANLFDFQTKNVLYLNKKNIIWIIPLRKDSNFVMGAKNFYNTQQPNIQNLPAFQLQNLQNQSITPQQQTNLPTEQSPKSNLEQNNQQNIQQNPPVSEENQ
jgi:hypothetical protein